MPATIARRSTRRRQGLDQPLADGVRLVAKRAHDPDRRGSSPEAASAIDSTIPSAVHFLAAHARSLVAPPTDLADLDGGARSRAGRLVIVLLLDANAVEADDRVWLKMLAQEKQAPPVDGVGAMSNRLRR